MSIENFNQDIDTQPKLQDNPEYQKQLDEKVLIIEKEQKYANKLVKANDVLKVLDLPDSQDDILRETLLKLDNNSLEELATKSKDEIQTFFINQNIEDKNNAKNEQTKSKGQIKQDTEKDNKNIEKNYQNIEKIKSILNPEILQNFSNLKTALEQDKIDEILNLLQQDLEKIINAIG